MFVRLLESFLKLIIYSSFFFLSFSTCQEKDTNFATEENEMPKVKSNLENIGTRFSIHEINLLEKLDKRRKELSSYEKELKEKEVLLNTIEASLSDKVQELGKLNKKLDKIKINEQNEEEVKIKSLVKIYESMHPRRAAPIFDDMDLDTLIKIVPLMKESKISPILASMQVEKARKLSVALAERKK